MSGALALSSLGNGPQGNLVGAIGGAVVGGVVGAMIEESATRQTGVEYVVQSENGALLTVVQGASPFLHQGQSVLVLYGTRSRLIPDPT